MMSDPKTPANPPEPTAQERAAAKTQMPSIGSIPTASPGNVDKIRDILFGAQMRDYEKRFARLEARFLKEFNELRADTERRLDSLEGHFRKEIESLLQRIKSESNERTEANKDTLRELKETAKDIEKKISGTNEALSQGQREQRQSLLDQSRNLRQEFQDKINELAKLTDAMTLELRVDKADRVLLANLFTEVSMRLRGNTAGQFDLDSQVLGNE